MRSTGYLNCIIVVAICAAFGIIEYLVPTQLDDLHFSSHFNDLLAANNFDYLQATHQYVHSLWLTENGRLATSLYPLFCIFIPKWLFSALIGAMMAASVWFIASLSMNAHKPVSPLRLLTAWTLVTLLLPWRDHLLAQSFTLNYILSSFLTLWSLYNLRRIITDNLSAIHLLYICPICFCAGMIHESYGVAISVGLGVCWLCFASVRKNIKFTASAVFYFVGTILILLSPAFLNRVDSSVWQITLYSALLYMIKSVVVLFTLGLMVILWAVKSQRQQMQLWFKNPVNVIVFVAALTTFAIGLQVMSGQRSLTCANLLCIVLLMSLWHWKISQAARRISSVVLALLMVFIFTNGIIIQYKVSQIHNKIISLYNQSSNGTVYFDLPQFPTLLAWGLPLADTWTNTDQYRFFKYSHHGKGIAVVPPTLRNMNAASGTPVEGDSGISTFNGSLFVSPDSLDDNKLVYSDYAEGYEAKSVVLNITTDSKTMPYKFAMIPFYNETGEPFYYITPLHNLKLSGIKRIEL